MENDRRNIDFRMVSSHVSSMLSMFIMFLQRDDLGLEWCASCCSFIQLVFNENYFISMKNWVSLTEAFAVVVLLFLLRLQFFASVLARSKSDILIA